MYYSFVATVETQYSGYVEADSIDEAFESIKSVDWVDAEDIGAITVKSIDDFKQIEDDE